MKITTRLFKKEQEETEPEPQEPRAYHGSLGDRILDRLTSSTYFIPIALIGGAIYYFGLRPIFLVALGAGCVVWWYWGSKITARDAKLVLVVDVETARVSPLVIGRKRWEDSKIIGRPIMPFRTAQGVSVEILKDYDPAANIATYPAGGEYSDIMIASIPERYGAMIDDLIITKRANLALTSELDIHAIDLAQEHIGRFSAEVNDILKPRKETEGGDD